MKIHYNLEDLPDLRGVVLTIGAFDGVHKGHRKILEKVSELKKETEGTSLLMTFHPHPRAVVFPNDKSLKLITSLNEKIELLRSCEIDHLLILPFTVEFSQINPYDYVEKILIQGINPSHIIIGYDHRFGYNREGNIDLLRNYADSFKIHEIPRQEVDNLKISSSKIRNHLESGNIEKANELLGSVFTMTGVVEHGDKIARNLGFPTANISLEEKSKLVPKSGTYAVTCSIDNGEYQGMLYIGQSATLKDGRSVSMEVNIFESFARELYELPISIQLHKYIREDQKFDRKYELLASITRDRLEVVNYFRFHHQPAAYKTTIAILNWNGKNWLQRFLPGVQSSITDDSEVVVIDNASSDDSVEWLKSSHPDVRIIELQDNLGYAGGYNAGLSQIDSTYVVLLNSDVEVIPGWLDPLCEYMDQHPEVAACQPKMLSYDQPDYFEYAGAAGGFMDDYAYPYCRGRVFEVLEEDRGQYDENTEVFWASGAALMIRSDIFFRIGGFDPEYFAHQEEIDLCWRLKNCGYKIYCVPNSKVLHVGGGSLAYGSTKKTYLNFRNNWKTIIKNEEKKSLWYLLVARLILDVGFALSLAVRGKINHAGSIVKAIVGVLVALPTSLRKRKDILFIRDKMKIGPVSSKGRGHFLLPWQHFAKGKQYYSDLYK